MKYYRIKDLIVYLKDGKQIVSITIESNETRLFLDPIDLVAQSNLSIIELDLLVGNFISFEYFNEGEILKSGRTYYKGKSNIIKNFSIKIEKRNYDTNFKQFLKIIEVFNFVKNNNLIIGLKTEVNSIIFIADKKLRRITGLNKDNYFYLEGSYIFPEYFQIGENVNINTNLPFEKCLKSNVLLKFLNLRLKDGFKTIKDIKSIATGNKFNVSYESDPYDYSNWLEDISGSDDPEIMNDVYWNLD